MKVICAGPFKTGTKSIGTALRVLGYSVYDYTEHFYYHGDQWQKILSGRGSIEDFHSMYENVDVTIEIPAYHFWKEILEAYPDAKIILTVRDSEDIWWESAKKQINKIRGLWHFHLQLNCTYLGRKFKKQISYTDHILFGMQTFCLFGPRLNEMLYRQHYRKQLADVMQNAPSNQLLVFNCKDGWEPLCKFLGNEIPENTPFPHENTSEKAIEWMHEYHKNNILEKALNRQLKINLFLAIGATAGAVFMCYKYLKW